MFLNEEVQHIVSIIKKGGIVLLPTDTVWGIACDATNEAAAQRVRALKRHPKNEGMVLLVAHQTMLQRHVLHLQPKIKNLLDYHVQPVTVVYDTVSGLPEAVTAANGSAAIRVTADAFCQSIITELDAPIVATAAHLNGEPVPPLFSSISAAMLQGVDYVAKYRQQDKTPQEPSVIVQLAGEEDLAFLRT